jgi:predicted ribosomally synthesized peptide with SipW-like signal peptide
VTAGLVLAAASVITTPGTFAFWTDEVDVEGTTLTSGTIDLKVDGQDAVSGYATLDLAAMVPGDSVAAVLTVANSGTAPVRYTAAASGTHPALSSALAVRVTDGQTVSGSAPRRTCPGNVLGSSAGLGSGLVGSGREVADGGSEQVCVQITLPTGAVETLQGATTDVTLTFTATSELS